MDNGKLVSKQLIFNKNTLLMKCGDAGSIAKKTNFELHDDSKKKYDK
jgi:hypothetical protein